MDDEPAFPTSEVIFNPENLDDEPVAYPGMSLRDYFAGQALAGCASIESGWESLDAVAEAAYALADAMMRERAK